MKEFRKNIKFVWKYTKGVRWRIFCISALNTLGVFLSIISPIISAKIIMYLTSETITQIFLMAICMLIIGLINNLQGFIAQTCAYKSYREIFNKMQIELGENILKLENEAIDQNGSGVFMERLTGDTNTLATIFNSMNNNIFGIISKIGIYIAILYINKLIFLVIIIMVSIRFLIERKRANLQNEKDKEKREQQEKLSGFVGELVRGARDIKMLNSEDNFTKELENKAKKVNKLTYEYHDISNRYHFLRGFVRDTMDLILIILNIILIKQETLTIPTAIIIYNYSFRVSGIAEIIGNLIDRSKRFNLSCSRIIALTTDKEYKKEKFGSTHLSHVNGDFEFKNVYFSYGKEKVLKGINFKIKANETVAFVGKSGAGKTTIFNLLCKMYEPQKGTIKIDGTNIKKLDK
ncbi:MAG: ABC transporter ATP-binding protein, partial [Bacilli bacterium]|nr:ABC transporter ATP-binding protein [Bacilli bacterium]